MEWFALNCSSVCLSATDQHYGINTPISLLEVVNFFTPLQLINLSKDVNSDSDDNARQSFLVV